MSLRLSLLLLFAPAAAFASDAPPSPAAGLLQMLLGLGVTLLVLISALFLLKRLQTTRGAAQGALMRIRGATSVGTREKVVLLEIGKQVLVLGVTPGRINTLHCVEASELPPPEAVPPLPGSDFANRLRQKLERRHES